MSYELLYQELGKYPAADDAAVAETLNIETVVTKLIEPGELIALAHNIGLYVKLATIIYDTEAPAQLRGLAQTLMDINKMKTIDVKAPASVAMLDALVSTGLITQEQRGQFEALGIVSKTSRAAQLGFPGGVTVEDIQAAREWYEAQAQRDAMLIRLQSAYNSADALVRSGLPTWADVVAIFEAA